jgi:hypothetical protein
MQPVQCIHCIMQSRRHRCHELCFACM